MHAILDADIWLLATSTTLRAHINACASLSHGLLPQLSRYARLLKNAGGCGVVLLLRSVAFECSVREDMCSLFGYTGNACLPCNKLDLTAEAHSFQITTLFSLIIATHHRIFHSFSSPPLPSSTACFRHCKLLRSKT